MTSGTPTLTPSSPRIAQDSQHGLETQFTELGSLAALLCACDAGFVCVHRGRWELCGLSGSSDGVLNGVAALALQDAPAGALRSITLQPGRFLHIQILGTIGAYLPPVVAVGVVSESPILSAERARALLLLANQARTHLEAKALRDSPPMAHATSAAHSTQPSECYAILRNSPVVALRWRLEPGWPVEAVSENIAQFGYSAEELRSGAVSLWDLIGQDEYARDAFPEAEGRLGADKYRDFEYLLSGRDGSKRLVRLVLRTFQDEQGRMVCEGLMRHVSRSLADEERLHLLEQAVNTTHNGIIIADARLKDMPIIFANDAVSNISGYAQEEFLGHNCRFLQGKESAQPALDILRKAIREKQNCDVILRNFRKDGTPFWNEVRISPVANDKGEVTHFIGVQADITSRKNTEALLARRDAILEAVSRATETLLRSADYERALPLALQQIGEVTNADHLCVWREGTSPSGRTLNLVQPWCGAAVRKYSLSEFKGLLWEESAGWPSSEALRQGKWLQGGRAHCTSAERKLLEDLGVDSFLCLPVFDGPNHFWGALTLGCIRPNVNWDPVEVEALLSATRVLGAVIQNRDTARALQRSEQRFRTLSGVSPIGIFEADAQGRLTYTNQRLQEMFQIEPESFASGAWRARFDSRDLARVARAWRDAIQHAQSYSGVFKIRKRGGKVRWIKAAATPMKGPDKAVISYVGTLDDVTDYHVTTEALRESESQYRSLVTNLKEVVFQTDAVGNWTYLNPAWAEVTGFCIAESLGNPFFNYVHPDDRERNAQLFTPLIERKKDYCRHEVRYLTKDGGHRWIEVFARLTLNEQGQATGTAGTLSDVTERRTAEETRRRQLTAIEAAIDGVAIVGSGGTFNYVNSTLIAMFGFERAEDLLGQSWKMLHEPEEIARMEQVIGPDLAEHKKWRGVIKARRRDGTTFDQEASITAVENGGSVCVCRDITERKRNDERIANALQEKEVMLKEIHHRVKNNMQIVSSLLNLQLEHVQEEASRAMFLDSQNRIASMALVHEKLYQSHDLGRIDFSDYVRDLTDNLVGAQGNRAQGIQFILRSDDFFLGIDTAVPCGLIINELVSNAYKHAFPSGGPGMVELSLSRVDGGWLTLEVSDNGRGIPASVDLRQTRSLGMQLVHTLVQQLRGTIEVRREQGTRFVLRLQEAPQKKVLR